MPYMVGALRKAWSQARWSVAQRGLPATLRLMAARALGRGRRVDPGVHPFDERYGVDTSGLIGGRELPGGHAHDVFSTAYFGVPPSRFAGAVERWREIPGVVPTAEYSFVDIGSGKGRALLLASGMGFREVTGVELNPELVRIAERNVKVWVQDGRAQSEIRVICGDATGIELPDGPVLVYLYNPFRAPVLRRLLETLTAAAKGRRSPVDVLYLYPEEDAVFREFPEIEQLWTGKIGLSADEAADGVSSAEDPCSIYRLPSLG